MGYRLLATAALAVHFCYPVYVILGGFLAWRWPKMIWPHLVACVWALLIVAQWVNCPLTWVENWAREKSGQTRLTTGFVDRFLDNVLYPEQYVDIIRLAMALVVASSWVGAYALWRRRRSSSSGFARGPAPDPVGDGGHGDTASKSGERDGHAATV